MFTVDVESTCISCVLIKCNLSPVAVAVATAEIVTLCNIQLEMALAFSGVMVYKYIYRSYKCNFCKQHLTQVVSQYNPSTAND